MKDIAQMFSKDRSIHLANGLSEKMYYIIEGDAFWNRIDTVSDEIAGLIPFSPHGIALFIENLFKGNTDINSFFQKLPFINPDESKQILLKENHPSNPFQFKIRRPSESFDIFNKSIRIVLANESGTKKIAYSTNNDHSWILRDYGVVRSKYGGSLWEDSPSDGNYEWGKEH
jgi:hypothetical protein